MIKEINSAANPFVKQLRALATSKKARQESHTFIVEGWRGIQTLLEHESRQYRLETLVISREWINNDTLSKSMQSYNARSGTGPTVSAGQVPSRPDKVVGRVPSPGAKERSGSIDTVLLPDHLFEKVSDVKNAQGILGVIHHRPAPFEFFPDTGQYLVLDAIRDPGNLGTLIRSAVGAGFDGVLLHGDCVEPFSPKVIRSSMGTFAFAHIYSISSSDIEQMMKTGYELCVTTGHDGDSLYETNFGRKIVLVIGSEAHGVSEELMRHATKKITIPLAKECESLNAAIAGSICMLHVRNS